jgi:Flp pilus assembly protein TadD
MLWSRKTFNASVDHGILVSVDMTYISGARWITWSTALVATVVGALVIADYALDTSRAKDAVATPVTTEHLKAEGDRRFAAGDVTGALQVYDEALGQDPADLTVYYRAGVALSHLDDPEQAALMFLRVVRMGPPEDPEVDQARRWLEAAGRLPAHEHRR